MVQSPWELQVPGLHTVQFWMEVDAPTVVYLGPGAQTLTHDIGGCMHVHTGSTSTGLHKHTHPPTGGSHGTI